MKKSKKILSVILACIMTLPCFSLMASAVAGNIDPDIVKMSSQLAVEIEQEAIVLLKNEDNALPLENKKVNVFGAASVVPFLGGAGSGSIVTHDPVYFYEALDEAGVEYNKELQALYEKHCSSNEILKTSNTILNNLLQLMLAKNTLDELNPDNLTESVMAEAKAFSDTAIIVIGRTSAENSDLTPETLTLSADERAMLEKVATTFSEVIVLFNIGNVMEMGFLDEYESIKAAAILWIPGEFGMRAVGQMLRGEVNPSGRLADTIAYSIYDYPSTENFGSFEYDNGEHYVEYQESIYVGYRYFETFAKEKVQYPFGYGLSYTTFAKELVSYNTDNGTITAGVKVTNTGDRAGKDTVQLYYSAPYYGTIEKSAINLGSFAKTKILAPGESETVTVEFDVDDMASYDINAAAWVLEKGEYTIILGENVREHIDSFTYIIDDDIVMKNDDVTGTEITNLFGDAYNGFTVLSRKDAVSTYPMARTLVATDKVNNPDEHPAPVTEGTAPAMGVTYDKTIMLRDVYENPELMDKFLDQLTLDEMTHLVTHSGYMTYGVDRLGIPKTWDNDGPSCVKGAYGITYSDCGTAYPCETAIACTWNKDLAYSMGDSVGREAKSIGTDVWYAPGVNIHRNPMGGRNFEYFSEDPVISGVMATEIINGAYNQGLITTIKHFALNDQETNRTGVFTWADEQTLREIYLKAFEIPVKDSECHGVMSAYNRIGTDWAGACSELLVDLLRTEWGFDGYVISDYSNNFVGRGYMDPALAVYNGNDTILTGVWFLNMTSHVSLIKTTYYADPVGFGTALREACRNMMIMKMRSKAFLEPGTAPDAELTVDASAYDMSNPADFFKYNIAKIINYFASIARKIVNYGG